MPVKSTAYVHMKRIAKCKKYLEFGFAMLICSILILWLYVDYFQIATNDISSYILDECFVTSIEVKTHNFNCWDGENANLVVLPCVKILLNTNNLSNVLFFRNIHERLFVTKSNADCSYLPTACQQNSEYMTQYLRDNMEKLFPKINQTFECFRVLKSGGKYDAILNIPHPLMYYTSLSVTSLGICISTFFIIYGALYSDLHIYMLKVFKNPKRKDKKIVEKRKEEQHEIMKEQAASFFQHIKSILEDSNVGIDDFDTTNAYDTIMSNKKVLRKRISCHDVSRVNSIQASTPRREVSCPDSQKRSMIQRDSTVKFNLNEMPSKSLKTVVETKVPNTLNVHF